MFGLGTRELIILAVILLLLFGSKKIPELAKSIVDSIRHIRNAFGDDNQNNQPTDTTKKK